MSEKGSDKYWKKNCIHEIEYSYLTDQYKDTYARLVSLEAKIEALREVIFNLNEDDGTSVIEMVDNLVNKYKAEYQQLIKEHNL